MEAYFTSILALGAMALLMLIQLIVADIVGIRSRHIPGTPVAGDHNDLHFRVTRAVANTNESIAIFILLVLFALFSGATPHLVAIATWGYVISRLCYTGCYYANLQTFRSVCFGLSVVMLLALLVIGAMAL